MCVHTYTGVYSQRVGEGPDLVCQEPAFRSQQDSPSHSKPHLPCMSAWDSKPLISALYTCQSSLGLL